MRTIEVKTICGKHCLSPEEGEILFNELQEALKWKEPIILDFSEVETVASSFLNTAVGKLFGKFNYDFLDTNLRWSGLDQQDSRIMKIVIENAKEHFRKTKEQRKAAVRITDRVLGD